MIEILSETFPLVNVWLNELREVKQQQDRMRFRRNIERIGEVGALAISQTLNMRNCTLQTPLAIKESRTFSQQPVLATILRAGMPLFQGVLNYFDQADCGFVAAYRKHDQNDYFSIQQDYLTCPALDGRPLIVADPMLATGASLIAAIEELMRYGEPSMLHIVAVIAARPGLEKVQTAFPQAHFWLGGLDDALTEKGFITPGLGDAGDLAFGKKLQR